MEVWETIPNFEKYECSNLGKIRNKSNHKILKTCKDKDGYRSISLLGKTQKVHRLVALSFMLNPENKPWINHKNLNKADNRLFNLEWTTRSENIRHRSLHKINCKLSIDDVKQIRALSLLGYAQTTISRVFKVTNQQVWNIVHGVRWEWI